MPRRLLNSPIHGVEVVSIAGFKTTLSANDVGHVEQHIHHINHKAWGADLYKSDMPFGFVPQWWVVQGLVSWTRGPKMLRFSHGSLTWRGKREPCTTLQQPGVRTKQTCITRACPERGHPGWWKHGTVVPHSRWDTTVERRALAPILTSSNHHQRTLPIHTR